MDVYVSLDLTDLGRAIRIAIEAWRAGLRHFEVGTPLIKFEGMSAVRALRSALPQAVIFADTKTADVGWLEVQMALEAGANVVSVLGAAPDETVRSAVETAEKLGGRVLADTLGLSGRTAQRAKELASLGVHMICVHRGVDEGVFSDEALLENLKGLSVEIGAAGGLTPEKIQALKGLVDFVMVGRYITGSDDPFEAAKRVLEAAES